MMENILQIKNLTKQYESFTLDDLSLTVPPGTIMGLIGENGAGKTTTIKLILNHIHKNSGTVEVFGLDNITNEAEVKDRIGVVLGECNFHEQFTAKNINSILKNIYSKWDSALFFDYLTRFDVPANKKIKELSKGMKVKLSIASALSHAPELLILDEATSGLDPVVRSEILDIFLEFIQDERKSILFSSHITGDLEKIADYIAFIHKGKLVFSKSKDDILYGFGIAKCGEEAFATLDKTDVLAYRKNKFGYEVLVDDAPLARAKYDGMCIDKPTIEEIMTLYVRGARQEQ
jgi:ABC-2 type transport system ATP-binding protein